MLKREDLTAIFSFKLRGAYNRIARLDDTAKARGVIAASAGNHAQGVAYAAARLGLTARLVMPTTTPAIKIDAVRRLGAQIDVFGEDYCDAARQADRIAAETGMTPIHPYDDADVIAGNATIALELLRQADCGSVFVPVGGGGLAGGIAAVIKAVRPQVRVIGVEPHDAAAMTHSIRAGRRVELDHVGLFADGVAVRTVGEQTFELCRRYLDECITVGVDEICAAIKDVFEDTRAVLEPAGALAVAGLKRYARASLTRRRGSRDSVGRKHRLQSPGLRSRALGDLVPRLSDSLFLNRSRRAQHVQRIRRDPLVHAPISAAAPVHLRNGSEPRADIHALRDLVEPPERGPTSARQFHSLE
jgi:threonine dehydratase